MGVMRSSPGVVSSLLLSIATAAACGSNPTTPGPCAGANPAPECSIACDPAPGATTTCPAGYHCSPDGACTAVCTAGGGECGTGETCTSDGRCMPADLDAGPAGPDADCPDVTFQATRITPTVQLLIDQSGSMSEIFGGPTRYAALREALVGTGGVVTALEDEAYFGATLYYGGAACPTLTAVSTGRALGNAGAIRTLLDGNGPASGTPTGESLQATFQEMVANPPPAGSPPIIVLATDGEPDVCANGSDEVMGRMVSVAQAQAAFAAGIRVFILSVGTDVANGHLQEVANVGAGLAAATMPPAAAPYYVATTPAALTAAFQTIIGGVVSCELDLDGNVDPAQAGTGTVTLNGTALGFGTDWELVDGNTIRLIGAACTTLTTSPDPQVSASFPCGAVID